jgi:hypothetical protein
MITGFTDNGSLYVGLAAGELAERLLAGERVFVPGMPGNPKHPKIWLSLDRRVEGLVEERRHVTGEGELVIDLAGRELAERLLAGTRICLTGRPGFAHVCLFYRPSNRELLEACRLYFPDGLTPDAVLVHASDVEPDGRRPGGP